MPHERRDRNEDWGRQIRWERGRGPYRDYGWEPGESALPEFRDPSVRVQPYERDAVGRWRNLDWDEEYNRGTWDVPGPYRGVGPKNYKRSDERIFEDACERLTHHGQVDARDIQVEVQDGEVTLKGSVQDRRSKHMAEDAVEDITGVKDVQNQLKVRQRPGRYDNRGQGRVDRVGRSGVYPASGPLPDRDAETRSMAGWGQGERGAEGYSDHGESEIHIQDEMKDEQRRGK